MENNGPTPLNSNQLAVDRTRLGHERTLLAWVRTSTSLISFGFTIYKFFQYMNEKNPAPPDRILGPREFALIMIGIGVMALLFATVQHRLDMKSLRSQYPGVAYSLATILAGLLSILGVLAFVAVVFRQ